MDSKYHKKSSLLKREKHDYKQPQINDSKKQRIQNTIKNYPSSSTNNMDEKLQTKQII